MNQLKIDQTDYLQILDILEIVTKNCLTDRSVRPNDDISELSYYRQFAKILNEILDEILDDTVLEALDGERVAKASKTAAKISKSFMKPKFSAMALAEE